MAAARGCIVRSWGLDAKAKKPAKAPKIGFGSVENGVLFEDSVRRSDTQSSKNAEQARNIRHRNLHFDFAVGGLSRRHG